MKNVLKSFFMIINYKTLIITTLSVVSTYICFRFGFLAKFPDMLVGVAIVFPVVFSISAAYTRREVALQRFSDFKGHAIAIYFASRDWTTDNDHELPARVRELVRELMIRIRVMFTSSKRKDWEENEKAIYSLFSQLSVLSMELRKHGVLSSDTSRVSQYLSKMIIAFDNLKIIQMYRTPVTLRAYSKVFLYVFPIIYGPYFAVSFKDYSAHLEYVMPILYSFILVSLDNIQDHLENPFDEVGEDDIKIEEKEIVALMQ